MNCYTVSSFLASRPGICAVKRGTSWAVRIGFNPNQEFPVTRRRAEGLNNFHAALERRASGDMKPDFFLEGPNLDKAVAEVTVDQAQAALNEVTYTGILLFDLDYHLDKQRLVDVRRCDHALVHVAVGSKGQLSYLANSFDEVEDNGRVIKVNRPFESARGVTVVGTGVGFHEEPHTLLRLDPGASFRLHRSPPYEEGAWEDLVIKWTGRRLNVTEFHPRGEN